MLCPNTGQISMQIFFFFFLASIAEAASTLTLTEQAVPVLQGGQISQASQSPTCCNPAGKHSSPKSQAEESTVLVG